MMILCSPSLTSDPYLLQIGYTGTVYEGYYYMMGSVNNTDQIVSRIRYRCAPCVLYGDLARSTTNLQSGAYLSIEYLQTSGAWGPYVSIRCCLYPLFLYLHFLLLTLSSIPRFE